MNDLPHIKGVFSAITVVYMASFCRLYGDWAILRMGVAGLKRLYAACLGVIQLGIVRYQILGLANRRLDDFRAFYFDCD